MGTESIIVQSLMIRGHVYSVLTRNTPYGRIVESIDGLTLDYFPRYLINLIENRVLGSYAVQEHSHNERD